MRGGVPRLFARGPGPPAPPAFHALSDRSRVFGGGLRPPPFPAPRRLFNVFSIVLVLVVGALVARHFATSGWPIHRADPLLVGIAGGLFLLSYGFKAFGWQRLFSADSRPTALTLAAAGGCAAVG